MPAYHWPSPRNPAPERLAGSFAFYHGAMRKAVITFVDEPVALVDEAGVVAYGGLQVMTLPAGWVSFYGASTDLVISKSSAGVNTNWDGDIGVGTATASNNGTLSGTEQNIIPTTATPQAAAGVTTGDAQSTATEIGAVIDGTATPVSVYLNLLVDDADHDVTGTPCNLILNGTLTVCWVEFGDN